MMKRVFSLLLTVCLILVCVPFTASAKDAVRVENAVTFPNSSYIRFNRKVVGVAEDFSIQVDAYDDEGNPAPVCFGTDDVQIYTEKRVEVFLPMDVWIYTVHVHGLMLSDGTAADLTIRDDNDDFTQTFRRGDNFVYAEIRFEQDAMTVYDGREFYTAVGSEWKLNFKGDVVLTDNYLLRHAALTAEGIGLEKQGNKYVFTSDGDGSVHIVIGGYVCKTESVHVREKQEIKRTMLRTAFENGLLWGMAFGYWMGPLALIAAAPLCLVGGVVKGLRMLLA